MTADPVQFNTPITSEIDHDDDGGLSAALTVQQRLVLPSILPETGSYVEMLLRRDIIPKVAIPTEVAQEIGLKLVNQNTESAHFQWDLTAEGEPSEIHFSAAEAALIRKRLKELDDAHKLEPDHLTLYEQFCQ